MLEQRIGRIHRLGQKRPIDVYNLVSRNCIEERIAGSRRGQARIVQGGLRRDHRGSQVQSFRHLSPGPRPRDARRVRGGRSRRGRGGGWRRRNPLVPAPVAEPSAPDWSREAKELVAAANPRGEGEAPAVRRPPSEGDVSGLFAALRVERAADGAIRIEAPPPAARALMALFEGMARLMDASAAPAIDSTR